MTPHPVTQGLKLTRNYIKFTNGGADLSMVVLSVWENWSDDSLEKVVKRQTHC